MNRFQVSFKKVSRFALVGIFCSTAFGFAGHNHDLTLDTLDDERLILTIPSAYNKVDDLAEQWGIAEDLFEPLDIADAENVVSLGLEDGSTFDITLPQQWHDSDDEAERTINLELADGVRISIFVPRKQQLEQADVFAAEENSLESTTGTVTVTLPDGTSLFIARPTTSRRAATAAPAKPKPDRVGVGEDLTDIPDINDPEGLVIELPAGSTVQTQNQ